MDTKVTELLKQIQSFNRPWRPGTVAFAIMAVASYLFGIYLWGCGADVAWWKSALWLINGVFLALWCNGLEQVNARRKK